MAALPLTISDAAAVLRAGEITSVAHAAVLAAIEELGGPGAPIIGAEVPLADEAKNACMITMFGKAFAEGTALQVADAHPRVTDGHLRSPAIVSG